MHTDAETTPPRYSVARFFVENRHVSWVLLVGVVAWGVWAYEAMPKGGSLSLRTASDGAWVVVQVADSGLGIPPDVRRRIFEPFFTTKETGTGLGLSIVSGIISSYGGTIDVESEPGVGTTFTIRLPAATET